MSTNFRTEVFNLCKLLWKKSASNEIRDLIKGMSVIVENKETGEKTECLHGNFAYIAKHSNNEFHGYIFLDDNIEGQQFPPFFKPEHLTSRERQLIEQGHKTLTRLVDLCLSDIAGKSKIVSDSLNPYFLYKDVNISNDTASILSDEELMPAVTAFKNGKTYKALMDSDFEKLFNKIDIERMHWLIHSMESEINQSLGEDVKKDLSDFSMKLHTKLNDITDVMFAFSILFLALRSSLKFCCRLLYRAICNVDLLVLNDDNIINIEKRAITVVSEFYKVMAQEFFIDYTGSEMGSILLIDCNPPTGVHIHEFGLLIAQTTNFGGEFGPSAKYSFITVNDELIHIHKLVEEVIKVGLLHISCTNAVPT